MDEGSAAAEVNSSARSRNRGKGKEVKMGDWISHKIFDLEQDVYRALNYGYERGDWTLHLQLAEELVKETEDKPSLHERALNLANSIKEICQTGELEGNVVSENQRERWLSEL